MYGHLGSLLSLPFKEATLTATQNAPAPKESHHRVRRVFGFVVHEGSLVVKTGRRISIATALVEAGLIWTYFMWHPTWIWHAGQQSNSHFIDALILALLAVQVITLALTSSGGERIEMVFDTFLTFLPFSLMTTVLYCDWKGFQPLAPEQSWYAWTVLLVTTLDVFATLGVSFLAQSRLAIGNAH